MKLHQLLSGIVSGYVTKLIQLAVSLLLVPFLLREDVLGLDGYGRAFTMSSVVGLLPLFTEGLGFSFIRGVSRAVDRLDGRGPGEVLGAGLKILGTACAAAVAATLALSPIVLPLVGLDRSRDVVVAFALASLLYWVENVFQLLRAPLMARGAITFVNGVGAAEVTLRALAYLGIFTLWPATLTTYFAIHLSVALLRGLAQLLYLASRWPGDLRGWRHGSWTMGRASIRQSWPITAQIGCDVLVHRLPTILANRLLGPEASGLVALAVNTIRGYVLQSLLAVLQPIAVPLASRLDPRQLSPGRRELLWHLEGIYVLVSGFLVTSALVCMPDLIRGWLGATYAALVTPAQAMLVASGIELAFNARLSLLIGQGLLGSAIPGLLFAALVSVFVSSFFIAGPGSWQLAVLGVALYFPISCSLGIDAAFRRQLATGALAARPRFKPLSFLIGVGAVAWLLAPNAAGEGLASLGLRIAANSIALLLFAHLLLLPLSRVAFTLRTLRYSLNSRILADPPDAGSKPS